MKRKRKNTEYLGRNRAATVNNLIAALSALMLFTLLVF
jgi:hypothetical protein